MQLLYIPPLLLKTSGLLGGLVIFLAALLPALAYCGRHAEHYSVLNHFISELGERGVSRLAWLFNTGLIFGGLLFLPLCIGLGLLMPGIWSKLGMLAGCVAATSVALVGVFPMNNLTAHSRAAVTYFRSGLLMVLFFSLAIYFQPSGQVYLPKELLWLGLLSAGCYAAFLFLTGRPESEGESSGEASIDSTVASARPVFSLLPVLEWAIFASSILWFFMVSLAL